MNASFICGLVFSVCLLLAQAQRVAKQKCEVYRQKTITTTSVIPLTVNPTPITFSSFNCSKTVDLIVGGEDAKPGEFPHQALLGYKQEGNSEEYDFKCGGSLISERFVLTAAHCMKSENPKIVRLGEHSLNDTNDGQRNFGIVKIIRHPEYRNARSYHDIALVKLSEDVLFSKVIRPACLWTSLTTNTTSVVATGFGFTEYGGVKNSNILQKVILNYLDKQDCVAQYRTQRPFQRGIIDEQLCVGNKDVDKAKDTCGGDSGGPIQIVTEPKGCIYHIVGVTSLGPGACGVGKSASIYTRVASYVPWIEKIVWS